MLKGKQYQNGKWLNDVGNEKVVYIEEEKHPNLKLKHNAWYDSKCDDYSNPSSPSKSSKNWGNEM